MDAEEYEEDPENVVPTPFVCWECFLLFPTTEAFSTHECRVMKVDKTENINKEQEEEQPHASSLDIPQPNERAKTDVWKAEESEAATEETEASILGERMKHTVSQPVAEHTVENTEETGGSVMDGVEIPSTNVYMYNSPLLLNYLLIDNTFGERMCRDIPCSRQLGSLTSPMSVASSTAKMVAPNQAQQGIPLAHQHFMTPSVSMAPLMTPTVAAPQAMALSSGAYLLPSAPLTGAAGSLTSPMSVASSTARMVAPNQALRGITLAPSYFLTPSVSMTPLMTPTVAAPQAMALSSGLLLLPSAPLTGSLTSLMSMASSTARMVAPNQGRGRRLAPKFSMTPSVSMAPLMTPTVAAPEAKAPSSEACLLPSAPLTDQWDNQSSRLLINLLKEYPKAYFIKSRKEKRADAWEMIRTRLIEAGFQFTVLQIRMRWRELCKKYRNTVNHNDLYNAQKTCQYFDDLNNLFGIWDSSATVLLIKHLQASGLKCRGQTGGTHTRYRVWDQIRQNLLAYGYKFTADQVQGRWNALVTLYQGMVDHNSKSNNEPISIAFKDYVEQIYKYSPEASSRRRKIKKKQRKPRTLRRKWSMPIEIQLLNYYHERVYRFNDARVNKTALWREIVHKLEEEMSFSTTVGKVRRRFCEMTEQFLLMEHHNAQPGTIHRESRHHEMLTKIYSIYNCWPHERYVVKQEKPKITRNRQVHSQLSWNDDESRTLLELYPQVLVAHHSNGDDQPIEEFWIQLAKAYLNARNVRKRCSEIENHIALLRRGFQSQNPFPFVVEMQLLEETESTLGFTPDPLPVDTDQLVPYWSHRAAHLLLDFLMHYRLGGIETCKVYEKISRDLANCGYRFTGVECRNYHLLLRRLYKERKKTRRNGEPYKTFPYTEKMAKLISTRSRPKIAAYGKAYWNEENLLTMLNTVKEYRLLCHDSAELERVLSSDELWNEVASRQNASHKLHPSKCLQHFSLLCQQYKSVLTYNFQISKEVAGRSMGFQDIIENILMPFTCHDADFDIRDEWWASEGGGDWNRRETLDLLFTVREFWPGHPDVDWEMVRMMMDSSGYQRSAECCQNRFQKLYRGYQVASEHNKNCSIRTRRRPPFYFKLNLLFDCSKINKTVVTGSLGRQMIEVDEAEVLGVLVKGLKEIKGKNCHSIPRLPLLLALSNYLNNHFECTPEAFPPHQIWRLLVQLHHTHEDAVQNNKQLPDEINLGDLWQNHSVPLKAYSLLAVPLPKWHSACAWRVEELQLLTDSVISWEIVPRNLLLVARTMPKLASTELKLNGFKKTPLQCQNQWRYVVTAFKHGGYKQLAEQINLIYLLMPCMLNPNLFYYYTVNNPNWKKKRKQHIQSSLIKTSVEAERTEEHMLSYVQVNVPQLLDPKKCHDKISTDEKLERKEEEVVSASSVEAAKTKTKQTKTPLSQSVCEEHSPRESPQNMTKDNQNVGVPKIPEASMKETKNKNALWNMLSYFRINVPQLLDPKKHHDKTSTDEKRETKEEEVVSASSVEAAKIKTTQAETPLSQSVCEEHLPRESPQNMIKDNQNVGVPKIPEVGMMETKNKSAAGNMLSYVQVNVPQPLDPKKHHDKTSSDEKRELKEEVVSASSVEAAKTKTTLTKTPLSQSVCDEHSPKESQQMVKDNQNVGVPKIPEVGMMETKNKSATGNILSDVQVNAPQLLDPKKHHDKISTDEKREMKEEGVVSTVVSASSVGATKTTRTETPLSQSVCEEHSPRESPHKMIKDNQNVGVPKILEASMMETKNKSTTGNIFSDVQVNVPQLLAPKNCHDEISTDEKREMKEQEVVSPSSVEAVKTTWTETPLSQSVCEEHSPRDSPQKMIKDNQNVGVPKVPELSMMETKNKSVKISTDEKRETKEEEVSSASSVSIKKKPNDLEFVRISATVSSLNKKPLKFKEVKKRPADEVQDMPTLSTTVMITSQSTPSEKSTYILQCDSQEDKVQVMILNVSKSKKATLIECSTVQGVIPPRIIRLYYPPNCKLPAGLTHMYIPRILVHSDTVNSIKKMKVSHSNDKYPIIKFEKNSSSSSFTPSHHSRINTESEDNECEETGLDNFENESNIPSVGNNGLDGESRRGEVIKLLEECKQEKIRLPNTLQESHQQ